MWARGSIHTLDDLKKHRHHGGGIRLAKLVLEEKFRDDGRPHKGLALPSTPGDCQAMAGQCLTCKDNTFPQMLAFSMNRHTKGSSASTLRLWPRLTRRKILKPIMRACDSIGSTRYVDFDTIRPTYETRPDKCHINRVVRGH